MLSPFTFVLILYQLSSSSIISTSKSLSNCSTIVELVFGSFLNLTVSEFILPVVASAFVPNSINIVIISIIIANSLTFIFTSLYFILMDKSIYLNAKKVK